MAFYHGIQIYQVPTALVPAQQVMSSLPVAWGAAPIHRLSPEAQALAMPGSLVLVYNETDAGDKLGISFQQDNFAVWGLSEVAFSEIALFNVAPMVFANLFDPTKHMTAVTTETVTMTGGQGQIAHPDVIGAEAFTPSGGGAAYVNGTDYSFDPIAGTITIIQGGAMPVSGDIEAAYTYADPSKITSADCIGGYDQATGITTGIALADQVFAQYRLVPAILLAPGFSEDPEVAAVMAAKAGSINDVFRAVAFIDIPSDGTDGITDYSKVPQYKVDNNLVSPDQYACWPKVGIGTQVFHMSTQAAGICANVDATNEQVPYASPSNKNLQMTQALVGGDPLWLDLGKANYLNSNGIVTALNFVGGWKLWGNRTACFPDDTDPKDNFLPSRRMMAWYGNQLTLTWWQKLDWPMTRRLVQTIVNSEQINLNSLTANQYLLGGRIEFRDDENATTDLMDGIITFHVYLGLAPPAEQIDFMLEYDPSYLATLFGST
jgi:hypothetical protein